MSSVRPTNSATPKVAKPCRFCRGTRQIGSPKTDRLSVETLQPCPRCSWEGSPMVTDLTIQAAMLADTGTVEAFLAEQDRDWLTTFGAGAINERVSAVDLHRAAEGKPDAERKVARAVIDALLDGGPRRV